MTQARPTLSVCLLARSSRAGLERLFDEVDGVADQIVVGVDAASTDDTFAIASRRADVVFRFEHVGPPVRARLLILEHACTDWVLSLDEDEGLDAAFAPLLPELLAQSRYTHFWFPRKWIVRRQPMAHAHGAPWFPDWQLRLFRNDRRRLWHPGIVHSGYRVMGAGCREDRTAILHYEPLLLEPAERLAKIEYYRRHGSEGRSDIAYRSTDEAPRRETTPGPAPFAERRTVARSRRLVPGIAVVPPVPAGPPWSAVLEATMAREAAAGTTLLAEVRARNTGTLAWEPVSVWPQLHLSFHLRRSNGEVACWDGARFPLPRVVEPGESARFLIDFPVPAEPGEYLVEWDLVSEGERWFADCGGQPARSALRVVAPAES